MILILAKLTAISLFAGLAMLAGISCLEDAKKAYRRCEWCSFTCSLVSACVCFFPIIATLYLIDLLVGT